MLYYIDISMQLTKKEFKITFDKMYINSLKTHNGYIGKLGEDFAMTFLVDKGHQILERNFRTRLGEVDIISFYKDTLYISEVKTSQSMFVRAEENMNARKLRKVARMGEVYALTFFKTQGNPQGKFKIAFLGVTLNKDNTLEKVTFLDNLEIF